MTDRVQNSDETIQVRKFEDLSIYELYELLRIRNSVFIVEQNCSYLDIDGIDQQSFHMWIELNGQILACLRFFQSPDDEHDVQIGRVISTKRRSGYGQKILHAAVQEIKSRFSADSIVLEAQVYAIPFYEKEGFRTVSEPFDEDGIDHVRMELNLTEDMDS